MLNELRWEALYIQICIADGTDRLPLEGKHAVRIESQCRSAT